MPKPKPTTLTGEMRQFDDTLNTIMAQDELEQVDGQMLGSCLLEEIRRRQQREPRPEVEIVWYL